MSRVDLPTRACPYFTQFTEFTDALLLVIYLDIFVDLTVKEDLRYGMSFFMTWRVFRGQMLVKATCKNKRLKILLTAISSNDSFFYMLLNIQGAVDTLGIHSTG